jgi:hypothetical protein
MHRLLYPLTVFLLAVSLSAFAADPFVGTWNLKKSTPTDGRLAHVVKFEQIPKGIRITFPSSIRTVDLVPDKKEQAPGGGSTTVATGAEARVVSRPNSRTIEVIYRRKGKDVATVKREVSEDGRLLTVTEDGVNTKGEKIHSVEVYERR